MSTYDPGISLSGSGDALVLVPGMDGTGQLFYRQVPLLAERFRVATYALRDEARDMSQLVTDLATVVDAAAPTDGRALIVGESFGGALALSFALAQPQKVAGVVILNSFPFFAPQFRLRLASAALTLLPWGTMQLVRRITAFRLHSRFTHRDDMARFMDLTARTTRGGYLSRLHILRTYDVRLEIAQLAVRALFLAAEEDHLIPSVQQAERMVAGAPRATLRTLPGHGHICLIAPNLDLAAIIGEWQSASSRSAGDGAIAKSGRQSMREPIQEVEHSRRCAERKQPRLIEPDHHDERGGLHDLAEDEQHIPDGDEYAAHSCDPTEQAETGHRYQGS